ncbi:ArnT family glycosyltransferase [Sinomonas susongensis]|uniref:ArnT family glycosyltransferase n=1 Tax=Sinomonas susongensis TaxID=1324851 RepID=UPI001FE32F48|nr:glycosyltransferase family 39 protein [Sinomonas susongensis]
MVAVAELPRLVAEREAVRKAHVREGWALRGMLVLVLAAYVWGLDRSGWANPYYSAAAQAGAQDWKAFFFGSLDWNNAITVDKTPLAVWPMALSVRIFGLSPWSILLPQALEGTAGVWVLFAIVRRAFPSTVAFSAAAVYAATPVVFLMSRYNNPEPLMGLLGLLGVYSALRTIESGAWRWYLAFGVAFGTAFMAKGFQGLLWLPAVATSILLWAPGSLKRRLARSVAAGAVMAACAAWWMAIVSLIPSAGRPYVGSSPVNNPWDLAIGYNGLARLVPTNIGPTETVPYEGGIGRLFNANFAQEIGWTLAPALLCLAILAVYFRSLSRPQRIVAGIAGGSLATTWTVLSFMADRIHTYYTYSLAVPASLVVALGIHAALSAPTARWVARALAGLVVGATVYGDLRIMGYADGWGMWPWAVGVVGAVVLASMSVPHGRSRFTRLPAQVLLLTACGFFALAPIATDSITFGIPQSRVFPISGLTPRDANAIAHIVDEMRTNDPSSLVVQENGAPPSPLVRPDPELSAGSWLVATYPAQNAALYQLETGQPSLALGGWSGVDPSFNLNQFQELVTSHRIDYFVSYTQIRSYFPEIGRIESWTDEHFRHTTANGIIVYDLRQPLP